MLSSIWQKPWEEEQNKKGRTEQKISKINYQGKKYATLQILKVQKPERT